MTLDELITEFRAAPLPKLQWWAAYRAAIELMEYATVKDIAHTYLDGIPAYGSMDLEETVQELVEHLDSPEFQGEDNDEEFQDAINELHAEFLEFTRGEHE